MCVVLYSTDTREKEDKTKEEAPAEPVAKEKPVHKHRRGAAQEGSPTFMANVFAGLAVYKTKMLVSLRTLYLWMLFCCSHLSDRGMLLLLIICMSSVISPYFFRTIWLATSTTFVFWLCLWPLPSTSSFCSTK